MEDPTTFTPAYLQGIRGSLSIHCPKCRVLKTIILDALCIAGRGDQPIVQMKFRCEFCQTPGRALIAWGDWTYDVETGELRDARLPNVYPPQGERRTH